LRHARTEPGTGDPPGFRHDDCTTQRNLDAAGRAQARTIGERLRAERIPVDRVLTSRWCRCRETATLLGLGPGMLAFIRTWPGPGNALLVTHQVNITAVTDVYPRSGELVAVTAEAEPAVLGRLQLG
jgi:hypothetical protein